MSNEPEKTDENSNEIPESILNFIRKRSNRTEQTRFPYKLFSLLQWVGRNQSKGENAGCGWVSDTEFFIDKQKVCQVMQVKLNTLNVNLKTLGFEQSRTRDKNITFYKNEGFTYDSNQAASFEKIRNSRCKPESLLHLNIKAVYLTSLEPLQLFMMPKKDIDAFKHEVVDIWTSIVGLDLLFAVSLKSFLKSFEAQLESKHYFDVYILQQALAPRVPEVLDIFDFAVFLARFGPFNTISLKLFQHHSAVNEIRPDLVYFTSPHNNYFSDTFHNCFRFPLVQAGEYHCYNLPLTNANGQFLIDEDEICYPSWQKMIQQNYFLFQIPQAM